jgi:hypothetical protein
LVFGAALGAQVGEANDVHGVVSLDCFWRFYASRVARPE